MKIVFFERMKLAIRSMGIRAQGGACAYERWRLFDHDGFGLLLRRAVADDVAFRVSRLDDAGQSGGRAP